MKFSKIAYSYYMLFSISVRSTSTESILGFLLFIIRCREYPFNKNWQTIDI